MIVFIDESGLSERPTRVRTWAPKGQTPVIQLLPGVNYLELRIDSSDLLPDLISGQVDAMFDQSNTALPQVAGGRLNAIALTSLQPMPQALFEPIDLPQLRERGASTAEEALRLEVHERVNALGIGAQGLGGLSTVLDVKVRSAPLPRRHDAGGSGPQLCGHTVPAVRA